MNYYDEGRPRVSYRPAYVDSVGRPIAPLPSLSVLPLLNGGYRIGVWVRTDFHSARELHYKADSPDDLLQILTSFMNDPEATLFNVFGYEGMLRNDPPAGAPVKPTLRLSDIGL